MPTGEEEKKARRSLAVRFHRSFWEAYDKATRGFVLRDWNSAQAIDAIENGAPTLTGDKEKGELIQRTLYFDEEAYHAILAEKEKRKVRSIQLMIESLLVWALLQGTEKKA
jgi:hypothetical protein